MTGAWLPLEFDAEKRAELNDDDDDRVHAYILIRVDAPVGAVAPDKHRIPPAPGDRGADGGDGGVGNGRHHAGVAGGRR